MNSSPSVDSDGTIFVPDYSNSPYLGGLSAINQVGSQKWYYGIATSGSERDPSSSVTIDDYRGQLYFGASHKSPDNRLLTLDRNGQLLWSFEADGPIPQSPAIGDDGTVYFGSKDGKIYALDHDGTCKWTFTAGGQINFSPCIGWDNNIYFGSTNGNLYSVDPNGILNWFFETDGALYGSAVIDGEGNIYFGSDNRNFYSLSQDGSLRWSFITGDMIRSYPAISEDGCLYFTSHDGHLYCLQNTVVDIKIDGQDGPLSVLSTQTIDMTISLDPGSQEGVAHDWWIGAILNSTNLYCWTLPGTWVYCPGFVPVRAYNGPLIEITDFSIHQGTIPVGSWLFAFVVDPLNNQYEGTYLDTIQVTSY